MIDDIVTAEVRALALFAVAAIVGTLAHELGHLLAAWMVGREPRLLSLGRGPILVRFRCLGVWTVLRALPLSGYAQSLVRPGMTPVSTAIVFAGGPLANLVIGLAALALCAADGFSPSATLTCGPWLVAQAAILASTLYPRERVLQDHKSISDGLKLFRLWKNPYAFSFEDLHTRLLRNHVPEGAPIPPASPAFAEIAFQLARRDRKHDRWAQRDSEASLRGVVARDDLPAGERAIADNLLKLLEAQDRLFDARARLRALQNGL